MYHLFAGEEYYPRGGIGDLVGSYETLEYAQAVASKNGYDWWHITDSDLREVDSSTGLIGF